jgi:RNA polymerase sigma factor (TIGR02999 family)
MEEPTRDASLPPAPPPDSDALLARVYAELRQLAAARLAHEAPGNTLQATALVHEAYMRLIGPDGRPVAWENDAHFFAAAAEAMRRILIDRARAKRRVKRGGANYRRVTLDAITLADEPPEEILDVDDALDRLHAVDPRKAELVKLRMYAGLTIPQAAAALKISVATAERDWAFAPGSTPN